MERCGPKRPGGGARTRPRGSKPKVVEIEFRKGRKAGSSVLLLRWEEGWFVPFCPCHSIYAVGTYTVCCLRVGPGHWRGTPSVPGARVGMEGSGKKTTNGLWSLLESCSEVCVWQQCTVHDMSCLLRRRRLHVGWRVGQEAGKMRDRHRQAGIRDRV